MAKKKKAGKGDEGGTDFWNSVLQDLDAGGGGYIFPKAGRTRVRLIHNPDEGYVEEVINRYGRSRYMILAVRADDEAEEVRGLLATKTVWKSIVQLLAEGYDFWDPEEGYGVTIIRTGTGLQDTTYTVIPSKSPVPLPDSILAMVEDETLPSLEEIAATYTDDSQKQRKERESGQKPKSRKPKKAAEDIDDEDDDETGDDW